MFESIQYQILFWYTNTDINTCNFFHLLIIINMLWELLIVKEYSCEYRYIDTTVSILPTWFRNESENEHIAQWYLTWPPGCAHLLERLDTCHDNSHYEWASLSLESHYKDVIKYWCPGWKLKHRVMFSEPDVSVNDSRSFCFIYTKQNRTLRYVTVLLLRALQKFSLWGAHEISWLFCVMYVLTKDKVKKSKVTPHWQFFCFCWKQTGI